MLLNYAMEGFNYLSLLLLRSWVLHVSEKRSTPVGNYPGSETIKSYELETWQLISAQ